MCTVIDTCRTCLKGGAKTSIFLKQDSVMISSKITSIAQVEIQTNDDLPSAICSNCLRQLLKCMKFIKTIQESDIRLRASLNKNCKQQLVESNVDSNLQTSHHDSESDIGDLSNVDNRSCSSNEEHNKKENVKNEVNLSVNDNKKKLQKQQCFKCGKVMSSRHRLKTHLQTHTGERPHTCPQCSKKFALPQSLRLHLRTHTGEKPLSCPDCGKTFAHPAGLAVHRRAHSGLTPYQCKLCPRSFRTTGHLKYHIRLHTGEKNFECATCKQAFITRSALKQHILTHNKEKSHICSLCGVQLSRASHLKRHVLVIHKREKAHECTECPAKFSQKGALRTHKKKHEEVVDKT